MTRLPAFVAASVLAAATLAAALAAPARADGFLIPTQPERRVRGDWAVTYHRVEIKVEGQRAHVRVDEEFTNLGSAPLESEYVFPLPQGAMVNAVTLMADGVGLEGRLLRADEARRIYQEIVRRQKDPALVEYMGRDFFRASIFPIPPRGARQLVLEYDQLLPKDGETLELLYPLNTEKFSAKPLHDVSVKVEFASATGIGPIYSPSHDVVVTRLDSKHARALFQAKNVRPETDFLLYFSETGADVGATLLTHWPRGEDRGYFLLLASPTIPDGAKLAAKPKDLTLVVDVSGSMAGAKLEQTKAALRQVIGGLNDGDVFNVISYQSGVVPLWDAGMPVTAASRKEATDFVEGLRATGGTNIDGALQAALTQPLHAGLPRVIVFMTDGQPTMGETTDPDEILKRAKKRNDAGAARIFVFGVGVDLNAALLDRLALENHGVPAYVRPNEDVEVKVSALYEKIRFPVLTDVHADLSALGATEVLPAAAPDLFRGGQLVIAGRYKKSGPLDVVISGRDGDTGREFHYKLSAGGEGQGLRDDFPARVWALRRIAELIDAVRLAGRQDKELVDEIVRLSTKFGILTEYTAFLADERTDHGRFEENRIRAGRELSDAKSAADRHDADGFAGASNQSLRRDAAKAPAAPSAAPPAPAPTYGPPSTPGGPAMDAGAGGGFRPGDASTPATGAASGPGLLKAKEGGRDVEEQVVGGLRTIANRAFYSRANVQSRRQVWVDAEVTDSTKADEVVERWSPRFFELLATTNAEENTRLAQDGDVLLKVAGKQLLVTDAAAPK